MARAGFSKLAIVVASTGLNSNNARWERVLDYKDSKTISIPILKPTIKEDKNAKTFIVLY